jgi:hypothetical protein
MESEAERKKARFIVNVSYWITEAQSAKVRELAEKRQLNQADIFRAALRYYLKAHSDADPKAEANPELAELAAA